MTPPSTPQPSKEESKHAIVKTDGYEIPLIGVSPDSTFEQCETCKKQIHIQEIKMDEDGRSVCAKCKLETEPVRVKSLLTIDGKGRKAKITILKEAVRRVRAKSGAPVAEHPGKPLTCPFCGKEPEHIIDEDDAGESSVQCKNPECAIGCEEPVYLWAWNTRTEASSPEISSLQSRIAELEKAGKSLISMHSGDCTIYASLINGQPTDGVCTCGFGLDRLREGDQGCMFSEEKVKALAPQPTCDEKKEQL